MKLTSRGLSRVGGLAVPVLGAPRCGALPAATHGHAHDEHEQHDRYSDDDYNDTSAYGEWAVRRSRGQATGKQVALRDR